MKKIAIWIAGAIGVLAIAFNTHAGQNFATQVGSILNTGYLTYMQTDNQGVTLTAQGASSALDVAASSVIQSGAGRVARVDVLVAGSAGGVYDSATAASAATANEIAVIPATVGTYTIDFPFTNGLVYIPGASQVVSISYNK